ncbi:MAG TPA: GGDEF domain-containing protein [Candidatus Anoxymicrobiaceae bacterium]
MKYIRGIDKFIGRRSKVTVLVLSVALVVGLAFIDRFYGQNFSTALFYVIPVLAVTWYVGRSAGMVVAVLSGAGLLITDWALKSGRHPAMEFWNALFPFFFFVLLVLLVSLLKDAFAREAKLSRVDPLTGLYNRRHFSELAEGEIERAKRYGRPLSLAFIDLDNFKTVNDTFGHEMGDEVLTTMADVFREDLRSTDIVGRFGGDEFAIMLPEAGASAAVAAMSKLKDGVAVAMSANGWPVTMSLGLVTYEAAPPGLEEIVKEADALMYSVKDSSKDSITQKVIDSDAADLQPPAPARGEPPERTTGA